ncbi:hypothetical protein ZEAMMB73_Zm00001d016135 [Zea mays]|jgi:hypothetical protein|uniref:Uncharacterized protein n=1 Tax=Zea mays TaxID=4577 RepID=A0A1D6H5L2_MAIZE|nr:hypothetical protein ZEAMMB73_Zm00001d016135 [Zea mays]
MAVLSSLGGCGCGCDKENAPPPSSAARGIVVKRQAMKRSGGGSKAVPRRRTPLRDITRLFVTAQCPPPSAVLLVLSDAALPEAVRPGAGTSDRIAVRQASHSLRMGFR